MGLKDVFVVTKPLQYINVLNINSNNLRVILLLDSFINSKEFFAKIKNNNSHWSQVCYFKTIAEMFNWLLKNKNQFHTLYIDSDLNYRIEFYYLRKLNITVYEEGLGMYRKRQVLPRRKIMGGIYLKLLSLIGFKNKRAGNRYTKNIIVYLPSFYKLYHNEKTKNVLSFKKPFLEHLEECEDLNVFSNKIDLNIYKDKSVAIYISSWEIQDNILNFIEHLQSDFKILKPHPHLKKEIVNSFFDSVYPAELPVEFLIKKLVKISKKVFIISKFSWFDFLKSANI